MKRKIAVAGLAVLCAAIVLTATNLPGAGGGTLVNVSPGFVQDKTPFDLVVNVFNPTGSPVKVTAHLFGNAGFLPSTDQHESVPAHALRQLFWSCPTTNCNATPRFSSPSAKLIFNVRYEDVTGILIDIRPGDLKRF